MLLACATTVAFKGTALATLSVAPSSGPAGSAVTANGSGFRAGEAVKIRWDGITGAVLGQAAADGIGSFNTTFTIPASAQVGTGNVWAIGDESIAYAVATFTVTSAASVPVGRPPTQSVRDLPVPTSADPTDPQAFDLSGLPPQPTDFDEQRIFDTLRDPNTMSNPTLLAFAHRQLGRYYAARGRADLAATEYARGILANPEDHRGYDGLAAISEGVGVEAGDGTVGLRDIGQRLRDAAYPADGLPEPEPAMVPATDPAQWQEVSAEFNRRMNAVYTSPAWNGLYRTVFPNLYGR